MAGGLFSSTVQVVIIGFIAFAGPGLFNALQGLGAAGSGDQKVAAAANGALYGCFCIVGYMSGAIFNVLGPKICFFVGGATYAIYAICMYFSTKGTWVAALGGVILGCGAGVFWTAQSGLMMGYATEREKGKFAGMFWGIFQLGACLGGFLAMGINFPQFNVDHGGLYKVAGAKANAAGYFTFIGLMCAGCVASLVLLMPSNKVIKSDGTSPEVAKKSETAIDELKAAAKAFKQPFVMKMYMFFFYSNWYYTFQFGALNGYFFNARAAGLNSSLYFLSDICGAQIMAKVCDWKGWSIKKRARMSFFTVVFWFCVTWVLSIIAMYTAANGRVDKELIAYDPDKAQLTAPSYPHYKTTGTKENVKFVEESGKLVADGNTDGSLINRLAWFPDNQEFPVWDTQSKSWTTLSVKDGCEAAKQLKQYYRSMVNDYDSKTDTYLNDPTKREQCFQLNDEGLHKAKCIWDIYQCVDKKSGKQFGRGMLDLVQSSHAPLCDLYQTEVCTTMNAKYTKQEIMPIIAYMASGCNDGFMNTFLLWLIGIMAGKSIKLSVEYYAVFKGTQSLGACVAWLTDLSGGYLYRYQAWTNVAMGSISLIGAFLALRSLPETMDEPEEEQAQVEVAAEDKSSSSSDGEAK